MWRITTDYKCEEAAAQTVNAKKQQHRLWMRRKRRQWTQRKISSDCECKKQHRLWMRRNSSTDSEHKETSAQAVNAKKQQHRLWMWRNISTDCEHKETALAVNSKKTSAHAVNAKKHQHGLWMQKNNNISAQIVNVKKLLQTVNAKKKKKKPQHILWIWRNITTDWMWRNICTVGCCEESAQTVNVKQQERFAKKSTTASLAKGKGQEIHIYVGGLDWLCL